MLLFHDKGIRMKNVLLQGNKKKLTVVLHKAADLQRDTNDTTKIVKKSKELIVLRAAMIINLNLRAN